MGLFGETKPKGSNPSGGAAQAAPASRPVIPAAQLKSPCTVFGASLVVTGEMTADEDVVIEGRFSGKLTSSAKISVGRNGVVEADLYAESIQVVGRVRGNLAARQKIELVAGGYLEGNIQTPKVIVAEGAVFKGNVDMSQPAQPAGLSKQQQQQEAARLSTVGSSAAPAAPQAAIRAGK